VAKEARPSQKRADLFVGTEDQDKAHGKDAERRLMGESVYECVDNRLKRQSAVQFADRHTVCGRGG
jgi:hypothetical protein